MTENTYPAEEQSQDAAAPHILVSPAWTDPKTGAVYVHKDLRQVVECWAQEEHISPVEAVPNFGDVDSWVAYVRRFARPESSLLLWNSRYVHAIIDYHARTVDGEVIQDRCSWEATHTFPLSRQWKTWEKFASGQAHGQREAVEALEDMADDIREPAGADLAALLRLLRSHVQASASTELRPDGTSAVSFSRDERVTGTGDIPGQFVIAIPVFSSGEPWEVKVRLRLSVGTDGKLGLRFSRLNADAVLDTAIAERVQAARDALGEQYTILRAAG